MPRKLDRLARLGLRWRLAALVGLLVAVCTGIAFVAVYGGTGTQVRGQIDSEIAGDARNFAHNLKAAPAQTPAQVSRTALRYIAGQPFGASSTLLFALVPRAGTASNRPELLRAEAPDEGESAAEQAQENRLAAQLSMRQTGYATLALPDVGDLRVLKRAVALGARYERRYGRVIVGVGEPLAAVGRAQRSVARAFILAGLLALVGALLGAYLIGTLLSRPLRRIATVAARVNGGDLHPRIHDPRSYGAEVRVLAEAFNHMLDRLTAAFAGQRAFVADASHELRTPLTVIAGQIEVLAEQENPSPDELRRVEKIVQAEIARTSRLVDEMLLLAKAEQDHFLRIEPIELMSFVADLWDGVTTLADRRFELGPMPAGTLAADPDRLAQALRNLLTNAIAHTAAPDGLVRLSAELASDGALELVVEDDGPGIPAAEREQVFDRFHRTDAARNRAAGGAGLGLAIVRAIVQAHDGQVRAAEAAGGGARIELQLPGFTSSRAYGPADRRPRRDG